MAITTLKDRNILVYGAIAKTLIYQRLHNKVYTRSYFIPTNKKTPSQQQRRSLFHVGVRIWQSMSEEEKAEWRNVFIHGIHYIRSFNAFMSVWMKEGVEMAVKQVISGYEELAEGVHLITIPEVDPSRSVVIYNCALAGSLAGRNIVFWGIVYARIVSSTEIEVKVLQSAVDELVPFAYSVIEFI